MKVVDHFLTKELFEVHPSTIDGILETTPIPTSLDPYYQSEDYISHHQDRGGLKEKLYKFAQSFNLNYKRNILVQETTAKAQILDYGCGAGEFLKYIENDFSTLGYEPNPAARNAAEKKTNKTKIIDDLNLISKNTLDAITLWHVFEHIENQQEMINRFYELLKTNGKLIIAVPNYESFDAKYYKEDWAAYDVPRHLFHFSKKGIQNLFHTSHWKVQKIKPLLLDSFYISTLSEKYQKNPLFWIKGPVIGAISNFKASKSGDFSSLIYIIEKI